MSGGGGRHQRNGDSSMGRESTTASSGFVLVTAPDPQNLQTSDPHKQMAALQNSGIEGHSLLCTESLPSSSPPPGHEAQLPAQASSTSVPLPQAWTKAHLPVPSDVQFALIVPDTFLASNHHLLARATLVSTAGDDVGGAAGAVVAVRAADIGVASLIRQDDSGAHKILSAPAPTLLREVVSLPLPGSSTGVVNGLDGGQKVSSSAILVPAAVSSSDPSYHLARLAEVAVQQPHVPSPSLATSSSSSSIASQPQPQQQQQQHQQQQQQQQQTSPPTAPASEGMHSGRPGTGSGHSQGQVPPPSTSHDQPLTHSHVMLSAGASAGPSAGLGVFRGGSLTHGEPMSRLVGVVGSGGVQYSGGAGGSSNTASMAPYPSLYSVHGQSSSSPLATVSPYSGFFTQYPAASPHYSPASVVTSARYPHIESYSAVLASIGSHMQHGGQVSPQNQTGSRTSYLPTTAMGQYSHRSLSTSSSPGPSSHSPSGSSTSFALREREALLHQGREREVSSSPPHHQGPSMSSSSPPEDKGLSQSSGLHYASRGSPGGLMKGDPRDPFQKVPSGKEGSLKHRFLPRPPGSPLEVSAGYGHGKSRSHSMKSEEELHGKRAKYSTPSLGAPTSIISSSPTDPHIFQAPHALGPGPPHSSGHYAHHHTTTNSTTPSPVSPSTASPTSSASHLPRTPESGASPGVSSLPPHLHYPPHFIKGSIIQLANGDLKRVEDLQTEDFVSSAQVSADLKVDSSTVVRIEEHPEQGTATLGFSVGEHRVQVTVEATLEHPFFVFGQGWSSCSTERTLQRYGLDCHKLSVGDVCISLTHKDVSLRAAEIVSQQQEQQQQQQQLAPPDSSPRTLPDSHKDQYSREHGHESKRLPDREDPGPNHGQGQGHVHGNGFGGGGKAGGDSKGVIDLSKVRGSGGGSRPLTHAHSTEGPVPSQPSTSDQSSPPDTRPPRKRRWSAPESDVEKEKMELEKQTSDQSQQHE